MLARIKSNYTPFIIGQKVWLEAKNLKMIYNKKMAPKREGPFQIIKVLSPLTFSLNLPTMWQIHNTFHAFLLTPYVENEIHGPNYTRPPAELEEHEEAEWEVECIIDIKNADVVINIMCSGKATRLPKQHGNQNQFLNTRKKRCNPIKNTMDSIQNSEPYNALPTSSPPF